MSSDKQPDPAVLATVLEAVQALIDTATTEPHVGIEATA
jgi:hypothetical protein